MTEKDPLVFKYEDIKAEGGFNVTLSLPTADYENVFEKPGSLKKLDLNMDFSVGGDSILLEGRVDAVLELECSRCGEPLTRSFGDAFDEVYPDSLEYIDTREVIRETAGLLMPMKVLCAENCKGRCLVCGTNRNVRDCGCRADATTPFSALRDLKLGNTDKPGK
jgi:uncharacterized protein